jgi:hypothetical protein
MTDVLIQRLRVLYCNVNNLSDVEAIIISEPQMLHDVTTSRNDMLIRRYEQYPKRELPNQEEKEWDRFHRFYLQQLLPEQVQVLKPFVIAHPENENLGSFYYEKVNRLRLLQEGRERLEQRVIDDKRVKKEGLIRLQRIYEKAILELEVKLQTCIKDQIDLNC